MYDHALNSEYSDRYIFINFNNELRPQHNSPFSQFLKISLINPGASFSDF